MFPICILTIEDDGRRSFMERLYVDHRSGMYHAAMGILRNPDDAEDAVQTVFLALCEKIPQLMAMNCYTLRSYIVISTRNAAIDVIELNNHAALLAAKEGKSTVVWQEDNKSFILSISEDADTALKVVKNIRRIK